MADVDTLLVQKILDGPKRERKPENSMTARRMTSATVLKYFKEAGLVISKRHSTSLPFSSQVNLKDLWNTACVETPFTSICDQLERYASKLFDLCAKKLSLD